MHVRGLNMSEKLKNAVLIMLPVFLMAGLIAYLVWQSAAGVPVKIRLRGYDPRDLLAGHYIRYELDWEATDCGQFADNICPKADFSALETGRFFVPEKYAKALEHDIQSSHNVAEMVFSYRQGQRPFVRHLLVNGKNWDGVPRP